jgi:PAS domain S-box-containing protein/diguanylate cyclase (GGDEF)-like protein
MMLRRLTALLDASPDATVAVDEHGMIAEWNPAAEALFGWSRAEMLDAPVRQFVPFEGMAAFEANWDELAGGSAVASCVAERFHRDGTRLPLRMRAVAVRDAAGFAGTVSTFRPQLEPPTSARDGDLVTDRLGRRRLQRALAAPVADGMSRAVAVLDIDGFGLVNQTYGPDVGDEVLGKIGRRLNPPIDGVVAGRWQADEFVYVVDGVDPRRTLDSLLDAALHAVRAPLSIGDQQLYLTISAGLAATPFVAVADLFAAAIRARDVAKRAGRDRAVWFDTSQRQTCNGGLRLASDLRHGIKGGQMRLHYQPIVELEDLDVIGVEALVRWDRPGCGLLVPSEFMDVAERTGQIVPLGAWVAGEACEAAVRLARVSSAPHSMSVNLSARQVSDPGVVEMLHRALERTGCDPSALIIEVTETALMHDMAGATATLQAIKALGVDLALDDFGTGYCSLLYLKSFPVDRIKIDQSFISGLGVDADDTAIVASTISLAHSVGVQAVAEGVETADQLNLLRQMGCDFAQGHLFSRALTAEQLQGWLDEHPPTARREARKAAMVSCPETALILRLHREGASLHTVAAALNLKGLHTELGLRWSSKSVAKVITQAEFPSIVLPRTGT